MLFFRVRFTTRFGMPFKLFFWSLLGMFLDPFGSLGATFGRLLVNFCNFLGVFLETPPKLAKSLLKVKPRFPEKDAKGRNVVHFLTNLMYFAQFYDFIFYWLLFGSYWLLLAPIGSYWLLLVPIGSYWLLLTPIGSYWLLWSAL